jgi:hypothetical protein
MKKVIILAICLASSSAIADCYMRSNINLSRQTVYGAPTDIQRAVAPDSGRQKCVMRYRIYINDAWQTAEGVGYGKTEDAACEQALNLSRGTVLQEVEPSSVRADNQMVCSDLPDIRVRPVRRGELIWESETDMHSHPQERGNYFNYKQAKCRKFIERVDKEQNLIIYQGIICQANTLAGSKWRVIDKY